MQTLNRHMTGIVTEEAYSYDYKSAVAAEREKRARKEKPVYHSASSKEMARKPIGSLCGSQSRPFTSDAQERNYQRLRGDRGNHGAMDCRTVRNREPWSASFETFIYIFGCMSIAFFSVIGFAVSFIFFLGL